MVWKVTDKLATLNNAAIAASASGAGAPATSTWRSEDSTVQQLIRVTPTTQLGINTARDVTTVSTDLQDIVANGFDNSNGGANLQSDVAVVQTDALRLGCAQS